MSEPALTLMNISYSKSSSGSDKQGHPQLFPRWQGRWTSTSGGNWRRWWGKQSWNVNTSYGPDCQQRNHQCLVCSINDMTCLDIYYYLLLTYYTCQYHCLSCHRFALEACLLFAWRKEGMKVGPGSKGTGSNLEFEAILSHCRNQTLNIVVYYKNSNLMSFIVLSCLWLFQIKFLNGLSRSAKSPRLKVQYLFCLETFSRPQTFNLLHKIKYTSIP